MKLSCAASADCAQHSIYQWLVAGQSARPCAGVYGVVATFRSPSSLRLARRVQHTFMQKRSFVARQRKSEAMKDDSGFMPRCRPLRTYDACALLSARSI